METVEAAIVELSSTQAKNEEILGKTEITDEISVLGDAQSTPPKSPPKRVEQLFYTNNYTLSTLTLIFIAIAMSTVVLISPREKLKLNDGKYDDDYDDDEPSTENESEKADDFNSSYVNPDLSKFQFIHGQLKDLSICLILFNITEANGACLVHQPKSFYDSSAACISHNMTLLEFNSELDKQRVFEETQKIFGTGGGTRIWMNGKYSASEDAFLSVPKNEKMPITKDQIEKSWRGKFSEGECLAVESFYQGRYHISSVPCSGESYFFCEF